MNEPSEDISQDLEVSAEEIQAHASLFEMIEGLEQHPDDTAAAILSGNFSADGVGVLGTVFRTIKASAADQHQEAWSRLMELSGHLADHGARQAAEQLLSAAHLHLDTPAVFRDKVEKFLILVKDQQLFLKASAFFDQGDDDSARSTVSQMSDENKAFFEQILNEAVADRRKSRRRTFALSGVLMVLMAIGTVYGAIHVKNTIIDHPPQVRLPTMGQIMTPVRQLEKNLQTPSTTSSQQPAPANLPPKKTKPSIEHSAPANATQQIFEPTPGRNRAESSNPAPANPTTPAQAKTNPVTEGSSSLGQGSTAKPKAQTATRIPAPTASEIKTCVLAYSAAIEATSELASAPNPEQSAKLSAFKSKIHDACSHLKISKAEMQAAMTTISSQQINALAHGVLKN